MSDINIDDYCKNPAKYIGGLNQETANYYNGICEARNQVGEPSTGEKVGEAITMFIPNMIQGILTPDGLKLLSLFFGVKFTGKVLATSLLRILASPETVAVAGELAGGGATALVSNVTAITTAITEAAVESSIAMLASEIIAIIGQFVDFVEIAMIAFMILSVLIDAIDPCGLGKVMSGSDLVNISNNYNDKFRDSVIAGITRGQNVDGTPIYTDEYPVVFHLDNILFSEYKEKYKKKISLYTSEYFLKLKFNSYGQALDWNIPVDLLSLKDVDSVTSELSVIVTDNNFALYKIVKSNFFWILAFITLFILFILFVKF